MERTIVFSAALSVCALLGASASAADNPCTVDAEKFCKGVQPGEGRIVACLKEHEAELSTECKAKGEELKQKAEKFKEACQGDLDRLCKDVQPGDGRLFKCLNEREKELSPACSKTMADGKEEFLKSHPCMADMEKLCKDVEQGEGRKMKCMKEHETELSAECKKNIEEFLKTHPCAADMEKLCKDIEPGDGRKLECMKAHKAELSEACTARLAERWEEFKKTSPCGPDIEKFCKDVPPGEGAVLKCLKEHEAEVSAECREKGEEMKKNAADFKGACQGDLDKFCKGVKEGEGRLLFCLNRHEKELSAPCKAKLDEGKDKAREKRMEKFKEKREERLQKRVMKGPGRPGPGKNK